jgi:hypothetical protein
MIKTTCPTVQAFVKSFLIDLEQAVHSLPEAIQNHVNYECFSKDVILPLRKIITSSHSLDLSDLGISESILAWSDWLKGVRHYRFITGTDVAESTYRSLLKEWRGFVSSYEDAQEKDDED